MRGRPSGTMTHHRQRILSEIMDAAADGERVSFAHLARRCGLYDYRDARRIVGDLKKIGALN